jgi:hypothetical protein
MGAQLLDIRDTMVLDYMLVVGLMFVATVGRAQGAPSISRRNSYSTSLLPKYSKFTINTRDRCFFMLE